MSPFQHISQLIDEMIRNVRKQNTVRYQKPHFLRILLNEQVIFKRTLNQTLRDNDQLIREWWMRDMHAKTKANYYTIIGEVMIKYLNDDLEKDILSLTKNERQKLSQKIIDKTKL